MAVTAEQSDFVHFIRHFSRPLIDYRPAIIRLTIFYLYIIHNAQPLLTSPRFADTNAKTTKLTELIIQLLLQRGDRRRTEATIGSLRPGESQEIIYRNCEIMQCSIFTC